MKVLHDLKVNPPRPQRDGHPEVPRSEGPPPPWEGGGGGLPSSRRRPSLSKAGMRPLEGQGGARGRAYLSVEGQGPRGRALGLHDVRGLRPGPAPCSSTPVPGDLIGLRQGLVMMSPTSHRRPAAAFKGMEVQGNPWGVGQDRRLEWAEGLDVPVMGRPGRTRSRVPAVVGCAGSPTRGRARRTRPSSGSSRRRRWTSRPCGLRRSARRPGAADWGIEYLFAPARPGEHRDLQAVQVPEDPRDLPALPQQPRQGLPRVRDHLHGRAPLAAPSPSSWPPAGSPLRTSRRGWAAS